MPNYNLFNSPIMQATWQDPVNAEFLRGVAQSGGAPQLQEAVAEEQAQNNFNRDMANNALMAEMARQGAYSNAQSPALEQGFMTGLGEKAPVEQAPQEPPQTLTQMARQKALDIINAKNLYAQGEALGGEQGAKAMELAHAGAERARAALQQLGVDPAQYGLNGTYEEAVQGVGNNDIRAMQNVLQGDFRESSGANYRRNYQYLLEQGFGRSVAERIAGEQAELYSDQRQQALMEAFEMYGHDNTTINPFGIQLLKKIAEEDIDAANFYATKYAGPLQEYADAKQQRNMATQHAYKKEDMAIGHQYDLENKDVDQQHRKEMAALNYQIQEAHANNNVVRAVQQAGQLYELQAKYGIGKGAANRNGISKEQATQAANMIKQIDAKLKDGLDLSDAEKAQLNADRAKYQSVVDTYIGFGGGQQSGGSGKDYDFNNYDDAMEFAKEKMQENADKGYPYDRAQMRNMLRNYIGDWADDVEFGYGDEGSSSSSETTSSEPAPSPTVYTAPAPVNNWGTDATYNAMVNSPRSGFNFNFDIGKIIENMRNNPSQTEAGNMAMRRYGR